MQRNTTLDNAKGIAILAVVAGHVLRGFRQADLIPDSFALRFIDTLLYGFHVQSFFLIAGFLTFQKAASLKFQYQRQLNLYYPYLLWSAASWAIAYGLSAEVNNPVTVDALIYIPFVPIQHFWFIPMLMLGTAVLGLLRSRAMLMMACAALLIALAFFPPLGWFDAERNLLFVLAGALIWTELGLPRPHRGLGIAGFAALAGTTWLETATAASVWPPVSFLVQLAGCYGVYVAACELSRREALGAILSYLGRHSFSIYLVHVIAGAGARVILQAVRPGIDPVIAVAISLICAVLLPLVFDWVAVRFNVARALGLRPLVTAERAAARAVAPA